MSSNVFLANFTALWIFRYAHVGPAKNSRRAGTFLLRSYAHLRGEVSVSPSDAAEIYFQLG